MHSVDQRGRSVDSALSRLDYVFTHDTIFPLVVKACGSFCVVRVPSECVRVNAQRQKHTKFVKWSKCGALHYVQVKY